MALDAPPVEDQAPVAGFDRWRARVALVAGPALFVLILLLPLPLAPEAHRRAAGMADALRSARRES